MPNNPLSVGLSNMSNVYELAKRRATIRFLKTEPIILDDVMYALRVAIEAPSGANKQPWRFVIIKDPEKKRSIREFCENVEKEFHKVAPKWMKEWFKQAGITWEKPFLENAPILLLVFADSTAPYYIQSTWLAIGYLLLALEEKGLATVTYTPSKVRWFNEFLKIPKKYILQTILPIGKPALDKYKKQPRKQLDELILAIT